MTKRKVAAVVSIAALGMAGAAAGQTPSERQYPQPPGGVVTPPGGGVVTPPGGTVVTPPGGEVTTTPSGGQQPGGGGGFLGGGQEPGEVAGAVGEEDSLPFTGFQAAAALLAGAGIAATGFALRRIGRKQKN